MVERAKPRPGRVVSPEETDRIRERYDRLLQERPDGPFHLPDALMVAGRGPNANKLVNVVMAIDDTLLRHGIMSRDLRRKGQSLPGEVILEIAEAIGEPRTTKQRQDGNQVGGMQVNGVIFDGKPTAVQPVREKKLSTHREPPFIRPRPKSTDDGVVSAKPAETAELKNVGPYALAPTEVYVLAFGLCMINRLFSSEEDERELRGLGLRLTRGEFEKVHKFIGRESEKFDLVAVVAQIRGKLIGLIDENKREDILRQNNPVVAEWLLRRFAGFRDQQSLNEALDFMFIRLKDLGMEEYFRGKNGVLPHLE